jgi:hypothetical protein
VMIGATIPLIAEARRRAAVDEADTISLPADDHSPWEKPERSQDDSPSGGRLALRHKRTAVAVDDGWASAPKSDGRGRIPVAIMVAGGAVIMAAVTLLKYFHLLGELSRLSG